MAGQADSGFDFEEVREVYAELPEFQTFEEMAPDAIQMIASIDGEAGLHGKDHADYWDTIGLGDDGFYDSIRLNGCSSCGNHTPGCCDGCA